MKHSISLNHIYVLGIANSVPDNARIVRCLCAFHALLRALHGFTVEHHSHSNLVCEDCATSQFAALHARLQRQNGNN